METTIRISREVKKSLDKMKIHPRETYNDIIELLLEDDREVNAKTKKEIALARKEKGIPHEEVMKRLGL